MLLLQEAAHGAAQAVQGAADAAGHGAAGFHPVYPWLIVGLPLLGFVVNGLLSVIAARRALPKLPPVGDPYYDHAHDAHGHAAVPAHAPALAHASVGATEPSEQEHHDHGTDAHPVDRAAAGHDAHAHGHDVAHGHAAHDAHGHDAHDDHAPAGPKPFTHTLPSLIAPGVLIASFIVAVLNFLAMRGAGEHSRVALSDGWSWIAVDNLQIAARLQLDPLSILMTLIITGVGSLIHIFSIGYMK
ncbi:MAG TPA: hypothetical protein VLK66_14255, partial [Longimicrobium sp.]|nr:hypothetical protein [Longimicrobium sp.]